MSQDRPPLPIDALLPEIVARVRERGSLVLQAEPGAGKTTRVPPALLDVRGPGEVLVLEPRRIAARLAARRVAEERGEPLGETVGYQVRFEEVAGPRTRIRFVTEGILTRRLLRDPSLAGVSVVVLDEVHERHLEGDLALALLADLRATRRPDLALVAMSATLEAGPIAAFLGATVLVAPGRVFPIEVEAAERDPRGRLEDVVAEGLEAVLTRQTSGDVLVFLPGAGEIHRAIGACDALARARGLLLLPLHSSLPPAEQDRALRPLGDRRLRKVVFATNVAESSITVAGVTTVLDSGLARVAGTSLWSGLPTLEVEPVSQASARQRAGRAGRTAPGLCRRLYTAADLAARPAFTAPEVTRIDLAQTVLELLASGRDPGRLRWLEPPPPDALDRARRLLSRLGALDAAGAPTPLGERLARLPIAPRLGRFLLEARERGVLGRAAVLAALLSERDLASGDRVEESRGETDASDDLTPLVTRFEAARAARFEAGPLRALGVDPGAARGVDRVREQLLRLLRRDGGEATDARQPHGGAETGDERDLRRALLAAYPDRVAERRGASRDLVLFDASPAALVRESRVGRGFLVAVEARVRDGQTLVRVACPIEPDWILDAFPDAVRETVDVLWDARTERVSVLSRLLYGALVLDESAKGTGPPGEIARVLARAALAAGPEAFADPDALARIAARASFARTLDPSLPELGDAAAREVLATLCEGRRSFSDLRSAGLEDALLGRLDPRQRGTLERLAPSEVSLAGRRTTVHYAPGQPPWVESWLQDFFGSTVGPTVGGVPLVLRLLSPARRPVQITQDLAGFWERHYPKLRRELSRRYPRHDWPEDPIAARPPGPGGRKPRA